MLYFYRQSGARRKKQIKEIQDITNQQQQTPAADTTSTAVNTRSDMLSLFHRETIEIVIPLLVICVCQTVLLCCLLVNEHNWNRHNNQNKSRNKLKKQLLPGKKNCTVFKDISCGWRARGVCVACSCSRFICGGISSRTVIHERTWTHPRIPSLYIFRWAFHSFSFFRSISWSLPRVKASFNTSNLYIVSSSLHDVIKGFNLL